MRVFEREKLLHAIIFFTKETRACHKLKLFKLLYFLDFQIYRETGKSVTGLGYFARPMGPVPRDLDDEFSAPR
ncbi:MAG: SocA family protein, partial [Kofleriaceae bacterium]